MEVIYKGKVIRCYAVIGFNGKEHYYLLSKKDTAHSGAASILSIIGEKRERLIYIDPSIDLNTRLANDFYWFGPSSVKEISIQTNEEALFLLQDKE